jgi:hypothetical protein
MGESRCDGDIALCRRALVPLLLLPASAWAQAAGKAPDPPAGFFTVFLLIALLLYFLPYLIARNLKRRQSNYSPLCGSLTQV